MFDEGPSKLFDAPSTILGLEELVEAEAALRDARLALRHRAHRGRFRRTRRDPVVNRGSCRTAIVRLGLMTREEVPAGASFAFDVGLRTLDEQLRRIDALDTKAGVILAGGGVLAGFLFTRGSVLMRAPLALGVSVAGALIACLIAALVAFGVRRYSFVPSVRAVVRMMSFRAFGPGGLAVITNAESGAGSGTVSSTRSSGSSRTSSSRARAETSSSGYCRRRLVVITSDGERAPQVLLARAGPEGRLTAVRQGFGPLRGGAPSGLPRCGLVRAVRCLPVSLRLRALRPAIG